MQSLLVYEQLMGVAPAKIIMVIVSFEVVLMSSPIFKL